MILIISESQDRSTIQVVKWLIYYNKKFIILNELNRISKTTITISNTGNVSVLINLEHDNASFLLSDIKSVWYRRGDIIFKQSLPNPKFKMDVELDIVLKNYIHNENKTVRDYIIDYLDKNCFNLSSIKTVTQNKLIQLETAAKHKLKIPQTLISSDNEEIISELNKGKRLITKPIGESFFYYSQKENIKIQGYTKLLTKKTVKENKTNMFTLAQTAIDKLYELRVFYFFGKTYSIAIYSQENSKTKIDQKDYDYVNPVYCQPYTIPKIIENKLGKLMNDLNLDNGSIDMIRNKEGEYIFLEVNPVGQFENVSTIGNYNLEGLIAKKLIRDEQRKNNT